MGRALTLCSMPLAARCSNHRCDHCASEVAQVAIASIGDGRVEFNLVDFYHNLLRLIGIDTMKLTGHEIAKIMDNLRAGFEQAQ